MNNAVLQKMYIITPLLFEFPSGLTRVFSLSDTETYIERKRKTQ